MYLFIYLFIYTFLLRLTYRSDRLMDFFTRDISKDVKSRKDVPFGVIKLKFNFNPYLSPKTVKFWPQTRQFFRPKTLNSGGANLPRVNCP